MSGVVHLSEAANLGLHAMIVLAGEPEAPLNARQTAALLGVSEDHLAKVLQQLAKAGLVSSTRGPHGGFKLARRPSQISLLIIYEALEGEIRSKACLLNKPRCQGDCILGDFVSATNEEFRRRLARTHLSDLAGAIRR